MCMEDLFVQMSVIEEMADYGWFTIAAPQAVADGQSMGTSRVTCIKKRNPWCAQGRFLLITCTQTRRHTHKRTHGKWRECEERAVQDFFKSNYSFLSRRKYSICNYFELNHIDWPGTLYFKSCYTIYCISPLWCTILWELHFQSSASYKSCKSHDR